MSSICKNYLKKIYHSILKPTQHDPWDIPLDERIAILKQSIDDQRKIALYIYPYFDATFRYRCYNTYQATLNSNQWQALYFSIGEIDAISSYFPKCNLLIIMRTPWDPVIETVCYKAHKAHLPILFDIDDLICHTKFIPTFIESLKIKPNDYDFWFSYVARYETTAHHADGFITTNRFLANNLKSVFNKPCYVIRNSLNQEQISVSEQLRAKQAPHDNFRIGYFSGSATHDQDFNIITEQVVQFLQDHPSAELLLTGKITVPNNLRPLMANGQVKQHGFTDYLTLQSLISSVDVCLVPLVKNVFTDCKSELKFFESAIVDTVTIASPSSVYRHAITPDTNGFLCKDNQWLERLNYLYDHRDELNNIAANARKHCLDFYSSVQFMRHVEKAYSQAQHDIIIK